MMPPEIQENIPLAPKTTLGVGGNAQYFVEVCDLLLLETVINWAKENNHTITILGGGSNVFISDEGIQGLVISMNFTGVACNDEGEDIQYVVGAGESFDAFVAETVERGHWGLENLSGIPGTVGATPIQNVGAYGVEVADRILYVEVFDTEKMCVEKIQNEDCDFGYRDSLFKKDEGKKYIILHVVFTLSRIATPKLTYKDLNNHFRDSTTPSLSEVRSAVLSIRSEKFPDWNIEGTAGSFFKNPIVSQEVFDGLQQKYPEIPGFYVDGEKVKINLGWILDKVCGLKGYAVGNVRLYEAQALVLVCEKGTKSSEIEHFADDIEKKVFEKTNLKIEREVTSV